MRKWFEKVDAAIDDALIPKTTAEKYGWNGAETWQDAQRGAKYPIAYQRNGEKAVQYVDAETARRIRNQHRDNYRSGK